MAPGIVMMLFGLWVLLRTVVTGSNGKNLAQWLLDLGGSSSSSKPQPVNSASSLNLFPGIPVLNSLTNDAYNLGRNLAASVPPRDLKGPTHVPPGYHPGPGR